jgi:predicted DCC family thiol-disulfide oxidoreductase YuxK
VTTYAGSSGSSGSSSGRTATTAPQWLVVLYDGQCPLCGWVRSWLSEREQLVPLLFVPLGSAQARAQFPELDHDRTAEEVTVISDSGQVWTAEGAWIMCLWATAGFRRLSERLSTPARRRQARAVVLAVAARTSRYRRPPDCHNDLVWGHDGSACAVPTR